MNEYTYTVILEREDDGGYHAFCPALRGCHAQGDSYEEAMANIREAVQLYLESLKAHCEPVPAEELILLPKSGPLLLIMMPLFSRLSE